jgi:endonuclease IV
MFEKSLFELEALRAFVLHPKMRLIPIIMELPAVANEVKHEHM